MEDGKNKVKLSIDAKFLKNKDTDKHTNRQTDKKIDKHTKR